MKKILLSILSVGVTGALVVGVTKAFFSSQATSTGNVFGSGDLVMQLDDNNDTTPAATITASFGKNGMAPGETTSGFVSMHNNGSIAMAKVKLGGDETVTSDPDLAGKLNITSAKIDTVSTCTSSPTDITSSFSTLAALNTTDVTLPSSSIAGGDTKYLCMTFTLNSGTDDTYQGKSITDAFTFTGYQDMSQ
jgi:predicted ribosomally synthesized peptide with SipW-like signal peptide